MAEKKAGLPHFRLRCWSGSKRVSRLRPLPIVMILTTRGMVAGWKNLAWFLSPGAVTAGGSS